MLHLYPSTFFKNKQIIFDFTVAITLSKYTSYLYSQYFLPSSHFHTFMQPNLGLSAQSGIAPNVVHEANLLSTANQPGRLEGQLQNHTLSIIRPGTDLTDRTILLNMPPPEVSQQAQRAALPEKVFLLFIKCRIEYFHHCCRLHRHVTVRICHLQ